MAGLTYATYQSALRTLVVSSGTDVPFDTILPSCIDYSELRIYRDLNLIQTVQKDVTVTLASGTRDVTIPTSFVVVNQINLLTPAGSPVATANRVPLEAVSVDAVNALWPSNNVLDAPVMFAMLKQWEIILGPSPDDTYGLEVIGTTRPAALSASNATTFISEYLPDLLIAASMVFMSGYMRNFGAQASDPQMGTSWEAQYQLLKTGADLEELRKKFTAASWTSMPVSPAALPQRG